MKPWQAIKSLFAPTAPPAKNYGLPEVKSGAAMPPVKPPANHAKRNFAAAEISRLTESFGGTQASINHRLMMGMRIARGRARAMASNNDHARNFVRIFTRNVVGPSGFGLQVHALRPDGTIDQLDSSAIETAFAQWAKRGQCEVTGRYSLLDLQTVVARHLARDGEILIRRVKNTSLFGYQLQLIDPALLDDSYNVMGPYGWRVCMGVEMDDWGKPVAYHLRHAVDRANTQRYSVPAGEIWHLFLTEEVGQARGIPPMVAPMIRLNNLGEYESSALVAARIGASKMGFFTKAEEDGTDAGAFADVTGASDNSPGEFSSSVEPGQLDVLPEGWDFKSFDPDYPHQNFESFVSASLKSIAAGLGTSYSTLTGDLSQTNYSSIRAGLLEEREEWKLLQNWLIDVWLAPMFSEWLPEAIVSGQLNLPLVKLAKFDAAVWQPRRWDWVDPLKDLNAKVRALEAGLTSPSEVIRETGRDPETVWRQLEQDVARLAPILAKINFSGQGAAAAANPASPSNSTTSN